MKESQISVFEGYLKGLQQRLCEFFEGYESKSFTKDHWERPEGGGGLTAVLEGDVFEKVGVNFSSISGFSLPASATHDRLALEGRTFRAMGVSTVVHPRNPFVPTAHMNVRLFVAEKENEEPLWWFGGGFDLTPYYPFKEDCSKWHHTIADLCAPFGEEIYPTYKQWADKYFYLPHRKESRGIGGLFFDNLHSETWGWDSNQCQAFVEAVGDGYLKAYAPIVHARNQQTYGEVERAFQSLRRGRYVEFNLIYDRGTLFGLQTGGRVESILISLPPNVSWLYNRQPDFASKEARLLEYLVPKEWVVDSSKATID